MGRHVRQPSPVALERAAARRRLESIISRAIVLLDALDAPAEDLEAEPDEDNGDAEPSLASPAGGPSQIPWAAGADDDRDWPNRVLS